MQDLVTLVTAILQPLTKREQGASRLDEKNLREGVEQNEKNLWNRNPPKDVANVRKFLSILGGIVQMSRLVACLFWFLNAI